MRAGVTAGLLLAACTGGGDVKEPLDERQTTVITTAAQLGAAENQVVRVRGRLFHEKLGDGVNVDGVDILCPDVRFPDMSLELELQGRLELWEPPVAGTDDEGNISQGVTMPESRWILRDCKQV